MATFTTQQEAWLSWAVKRLLNKAHLSEVFLPGEDPAPSGGADILPSHVTVSAYSAIGEELELPAPVLANGASTATVRRYGDAADPPTNGLKLVRIPSVPNNRGWIAVDGVTPTSTPIATQGPGVGFLDEWVDGADPQINAQGQTYKAQLWWGSPSPRWGGELLPSHPAGPLWDPSTGILVFTKADPYEVGVAEGSDFWFTGFLYVGESLGQRLDSSSVSGQVWNKIEGCVPGTLLGLGSLGQDVAIDVNPAIAEITTVLVFQNGAALVRGVDFTVAGDGLSITFTQDRRILEDGDEIQLLYPTS